MKNLKIPVIEGLAYVPDARLGKAMEKDGSRHAIGCVNWPEAYPYAPSVVFYIARSGDMLFIKYAVRGEGIVRAVYAGDNDPVWEDSCVEFFVKLPDAAEYCNFEFNATGACKASHGAGRSGRTDFGPEAMSRIIRVPSLGREPFGRREVLSWELVVGIPIPLFAGGGKGVPGELAANFYKCGDKTAVPHFLSWSPVDTPEPDFHRPEFFGKIIL